MKALLTRDNLTRLAVAGLILLSGVAMAPFIELPRQKLDWTLFAGVYEPELVVDQPSGAPGSVFTFTGSNYPLDALATVYADGEALGTLTTDSNGGAQFLLATQGALPGHYDITLEVDINASATVSIHLDESEPVLPPPAGFDGPTFAVGHPLFLPFVTRP